MTMRKILLFSLPLLVYAVPLVAQDTLQVRRLLTEWRVIDSAAVRLLASARNSRRTDSAAALSVRIARANALLDTIKSKPALSRNSEALDALRLHRTEVGDSLYVVHTPCPRVDAARADSLIVSAIFRAIASEQCVLEDLSLRRLEREALLATIIQAAERAAESRSQLEMLREIRQLLTSDPTDSGMLRLAPVLRSLTESVAQLRSSMSSLDTAIGNHDVRMSRLHPTVPPNRRPTGEPARDSLTGPTAGSSARSWRWRLISALAGAAVGAGAVAIGR